MEYGEKGQIYAFPGESPDEKTAAGNSFRPPKS
jgi:hypothetical protein